MRVAFRVDASTAIGTGHVARCLALALGLRRLGAEVHFVCRAHAGHQGDAIERAGLRLHLLPVDPQAPTPSLGASWSQDAEQSAALLGPLALDWLVVDHYQLDARWERRLQASAGRLMAIDDLADRPHDVAVLLDQNLTATADAYRDRLPARCATWLGPRHALLREEFAVAAQAPRTIAPTATRVIVSFGGSDPGGETLKALRALEAVGATDVTVVAGAANPAFDDIRSACERRGWPVERHVSDMAARLLQADLCVGAGGTTTWERAAVGLPTLCVAIADNQHANAQAMHALGAHWYLGPAAAVSADDLARAVTALAADASRRATMAQRSKQLVDGRGVERVAGLMTGTRAPS